VHELVVPDAVEAFGEAELAEAPDDDPIDDELAGDKL